jgi:hypothetical protein
MNRVDPDEVLDEIETVCRTRYPSSGRLHSPGLLNDELIAGNPLATSRLLEEAMC